VLNPVSTISLESPSLTAEQRYRGTLFLCLAVGLVSMTMTIQMALNANFLREDIGVNGLQMGQIEAARESCGILAFFILALLAGIAEPLIASAVLLFVAAGLGAYAFVPQSYLFVLGLSMIWSQGLHIWMPLPNSIALGLAEPGKTGRKLGILATSGAIGAFVGLGVAMFMEHMGVHMRKTYLIAGAAAVLAAGACLGIPRNTKARRPRLALRRGTALYFVLCFLEGWRKQVFLAFSAFLLVSVYEMPVMTMLTLWAIAQVIITFCGPLVGRVIDRVGERKVLYTYYASMLVVFIGYAFAPWIWPDESVRRMALYVLFVIDGSFFILGMAMTTFVNRVVPPEERTATLSAGVAMNHVAAVSMPFIGGILWQYGSMWTFLIGAVAAVASLVAVGFVPRREVASSQ